MKKILLALLVLMMISSCSLDKQKTNTQQAQLSILSPSGAPAISLAHLINKDTHNVTIVDGSDVLQTAFVNPDPQYDMIVAPTNLGVKLIQSGKSEYRLAAIITWGNLYVVSVKDGKELSDKDLKFAAFGENAVPGLVFNTVEKELALHDIVYYNAVTEAQTALLSSHADAALLAEPAATATIAKGKQNGLDLQIAADVQALWQRQTGFEGYPQAGIFVRCTQENEKLVDDVLIDIQSTLNNYAEGNTEELRQNIDLAGIETLKVPSSDIIVKCYDRLGLYYRKASECEKELQEFLSLFKIEYDASIVIR